MKIYFILILFFSQIIHGFCQRDTTFWFAVPHSNPIHGNGPIVLRVTSTTTQTAIVTINQPANPSFSSIIVMVAPYQSQMIDLTPFIGQLENTIPNTVWNYGLKISSTQPITAYYEINNRANPEIFALKGKNALGTAFYTPFQTVAHNGFNSYSSFDLVATENNTIVTITPSIDVFGHLASVPFSVTLNQGQTYSTRSLGSDQNQHPAGSKIISNKPIAVTLKDDSVWGGIWGGCADMCGDQMIPTSLIGKEYIVKKGDLNGPDKIFILATCNNTQIFVDGSTNPIATIQEANTYILDLVNTTAYIRTSEPAYVAHLSGFGCELGMPILPPIRCTGSNIVGFTRSTEELFLISVIVENGFQDGFELNGNATILTASDFSPVAGTNGAFVIAQKDLATIATVGTGNILKNTRGKFHLGIINGGRNIGARFGYFSDYNTFSLEAKVNNPICRGGELRLSTDSIALTTYQWTSSNGLNSSNANVIIAPVTVADAGRYILTANYNNCITKRDTIDITPNQITTIQSQTMVVSNYNGFPVSCKSKADGIARVSATGITNYSVKWLTNPVQNGLEATGLGAGIHKVVVIAQNGCQDTAMVELSEPDSIQFKIAPIRPICEGNQDGKITLNTIQGGISPFTMTVNAQSISNVQKGYTLTGRQAGSYTIQITDVNNCLSMPLEVIVPSIPKLELITSNDTVIKLRDSVWIWAKPNNRQNRPIEYKWYPIISLSCDTCAIVIAKPEQSTNYQVIGRDEYGCKTTKNILVKVTKENLIYVPNTFSPNNDGANDKFTIYTTQGIRQVKEFQIFNRLGARVFSKQDFSPNDENNGWDGTFNGSNAPTDVYVWYILFELTDGSIQESKGDVTLAR